MVINALASAIDARLVEMKVAYQRQAQAMLLAGNLTDAQILAHKAEAFHAASVLVLETVNKFKDPEDE